MQDLLSILPSKLNGITSDQPFYLLIRTILICAIPFVIVLALWLYDTTDIPYIENLPAVPAIPILGNLLQLGTEQPRRLFELSKKYGPIFQIRLGNRVRHLPFPLSSFPYHNPPKDKLNQQHQTNKSPEIRRRNHLRLRQTTLDQQPIQPHLPPHAAHLPQRPLLLPRLHNRHLPMGRLLQTPPESSRSGCKPPCCSLIHAFRRPRILR